MILVTGANGLVGSYLIYTLCNRGNKVRALVHNRKSLERTRHIFRSLGANPDELISKIDWFDGDVLDVTALEEAMTGVDYVYHCAAIVSFDPSDRNHMMKVNVEGTANVINAALEAKVRKFCHISSIASLGRTEETNVIDENSEWRSSSYNSQYSRSKFQAEREVWRGSAEGLPVVIVNPSIILGYGHPEKGSTKLFKTMYKNSLFYGKGINGFVDVRDVVNAMILLMESDIVNERFIVSQGSHSYRHIFSLIAKGFNKPVPKIEIPDFLLELVWRFEALRTYLTKSKPLITKETATTSKNEYYYSSSKLVKTLDYKYIPIEDTINTICRMIEPELKSGIRN